MCPYDEDEEEEVIPGAPRETGPSGLAHWLVEQFGGDERFDSVEVAEPGTGEGETVRVMLIINDSAHFFIGIYSEDNFVRVGLATDDQETSEEIEAAGEESGSSLTEFLADALGTDEELDHEVQHFHDDAYYFCSDIPYRREEDLSGDILHDEIVYYLDGYVNAFYDFLDVEED